VSVAEQLGLNIRVSRTRRQLTQEGLADAAELHPTYISEIERGKRRISVETLLKIAKALNCSVSELLDGISV
jgi:transcriptional regulator with XRE-family HTH domain